MQLAELLALYPCAEGTPTALEISGLSYDTRTLLPGNVFVAVKGERVDAHDRIFDAIAKGAVAVVVDATWKEQHPEPLGVPTFVAANTRDALAWLASRFYDEPSEKLRVVGVTGTNGKTTTTHLLEAILQEAGRTTGIIGTLGSRFGADRIATGHTTPQSLELQELFARMRRSGADAVVMEVSSHALDQSRVAHTAFDVGVFTNLTVDHLDYHETLEAYGAAKAKLFAMLPASGHAIINRDDPHYERFVSASTAPVTTYSSLGQPADLRAEGINLMPGGSTWELVTTTGRQAIKLRLPGMFNIQNALAAAGAAMAMGVDLQTIARGLTNVGGVSGRFEVVTAPTHPFTVLVDFAHTPDGLENVLRTARAFTLGKLSVVFGCGGDRDTTKRPEMGRLATELADRVYLTSDNPRSESPEAIMQQVAAGMKAPAREIVDRAEAIRQAVQEARPGDVVVIAGKGHETYQIIGDQTLPFDDREVARQSLLTRAVSS